ncbi:MAG: NTP transferase domain-containing protein [Bacteroidales bacterium]|jgi:NDP-sugar pyrophosphorylase family protein|nr:NTP transferase domain-containing protein [Bacteroidales bacterium]
MEAMIFAAGLGTRLRPLTDNKPKALITIGNTTLLDINIKKLITFGCKRIVINVHHFAEMIINYIKTKNYDAEILISDESSMLLDTGGGLLNARPLFSQQENIILHNADIISDLNFNLLEQQHIAKNDTIATLAVSKRQTTRMLLFNRDMQLSGWRNEATNEEIITNQTDILTALGFSGISIVSPAIFDMLYGTATFSITNQYLEISKKHSIKGFVHNADRWLDVGKPSALSVAEKLYSQLL